MNRQELEHLLRASGAIIGETQFIVIGSQSILGKYPDAPKEMLKSVEADFFAKTKPGKTEQLNAIGELSAFHNSYGYYVDPVDERTATLPKGWKGRLVSIHNDNTNGVTGLCLEPHDLFIAKIAAGRPKDMAFVKLMVEVGMVDQANSLKLAKTVENPKDDPSRSARISQKIEKLFAENRPSLQTDGKTQCICATMNPSQYATALHKLGGEGVATIHLPRPNIAYIGKVIQFSDTHIVQKVGKHSGIAHDISKLTNAQELMRQASAGALQGKSFEFKYGDKLGTAQRSLVQPVKEKATPLTTARPKPPAPGVKR